jgi:hypothetical protein
MVKASNPPAIGVEKHSQPEGNLAADQRQQAECESDVYRRASDFGWERGNIPRPFMSQP